MAEVRKAGYADINWATGGTGAAETTVSPGGVTVTKVDATQLMLRSVSGSVEDWLVGSNSLFVNVKEYDATGDGSTDDTDTIQAAIDAVNAAGGGIVFFPAGTYKVTQQGAIGVVGGNYALMLKSNVALMGVGPSSVINCTSTSTTVIVADTSATDGAHNTNLRIARLKIAGAEVADTSNRGVYFLRTNYSSIEDVEITGTNIGFQSDRPSSDTNFNTGIVVQNCYIHDTFGLATGNGTAVLFGYTDGFKVLNNRLYDPDEHCIYVTVGTSNYVIANNDCRSANAYSSGYGIHVWLEATAATTIYGSIVNNNVVGGKTGILVAADAATNVYRIIVSGNTVYNTASHGIHASYANRIVISGNVVYNSGDTGIEVDATNAAAITGNISEGNQDHGLQLVTSTYCTITGNIFLNNDQAGAGSSGINLATNSTYNVINGNTAADFQTPKTQEYGIAIGSGSNYNTVTWNDIQANLTGPANNAGTGNQIITKGSAAPTTGTWASGDIVYNTSNDNVVLWKCTTGGTPGTWASLSLP